MGSERALAQRIAHEREKRELSYEGLAHLMTNAGCSIQGSALYRIEKGNPPRRIGVDELVALARVFDVDVAELLRPIEAVLFEEIERVDQREDRAVEQLFEAVEDLQAALVERFTLWRRAVEDGDEKLKEALRTKYGRSPLEAMESEMDEISQRFPGTPQLGSGRQPIHDVTDGLESLFEGLYAAVDKRVWGGSGGKPWI